MAGLGNPVAPQQEPAPAPAAAPPAEAPEGEAVTAEEQAQYDRFEQQLLKILYPEGGEAQISPQVLDNLKGNFDPRALAMFEAAEPPLTDSPQDCVAATAVLMTLLVESSSGVDFSDDVVMHGGKIIIEEMVEIAEAAKIHDFSDEEIEGVLFRAMDLYRISSPRVDPEALKAEFGRLVEADKAGNVGKVLPGLPGGAAMAKAA